MQTTLTLLAAALAFTAPMAMAQHAPTPPEAREAMRKVIALLEGRWRGSGTVQIGGKRYTLDCTLTAVSKADGTVLLMDAPYSLAPHERPNEAAPHNEIAVLSFDPMAREFRFDVFYADGSHETGPGRLDGGVLRIINAVPSGGFRRITIDLTSPGLYHETGERSHEGSTWEKYSELVLKRVQP